MFIKRVILVLFGAFVALFGTFWYLFVTFWDFLFIVRLSEHFRVHPPHCERLALPRKVKKSYCTLHTSQLVESHKTKSNGMFPDFDHKENRKDVLKNPFLHFHSAPLLVRKRQLIIVINF